MLNNAKRFISLLVSGLLLVACSLPVSAVGSTTSDMTPTGEIDAYIYQMVEDYKNGEISLALENKSAEARELFSSLGMGNENSNVEHIYATKQITESTYEATQISFYSLEQTTQDFKNGVILFCTIVYDQKDFGNPWRYVMLTEVKGGVVQNNNNYWCEALRMRYIVSGDAFNANGSRVGHRANSTEYGAQTYAPTVGTKYSLDGPSDYYYNMGAWGSRVTGWVKGTISFRLSSNTVPLEVVSSINSIH